MAFIVANLALSRCTMGVAPMPILVLPKGVYYVTPAISIATIIDSIPMLNIKPFVLCSSPANPAVAAIIAATLGSVTKGPCVPVTVTWMPMAPTVLVRNFPVLVSSSKLLCMFGGVISIDIPGQFQDNTK